MEPSTTKQSQEVFRYSRYNQTHGTLGYKIGSGGLQVQYKQADTGGLQISRYNQTQQPSIMACRAEHRTDVSKYV